MEKYIKRKNELDMLVMKFLIDDNPALDREYVKQLKKEYTGVFYRRYILGEWCIAQGLIYELKENNITDEMPASGLYYISVDYGTLNPFSAGLWCLSNEKAIRVREYYYSGRERSAMKTDEEYYAELEKLAGDLHIQCVVVDPSAASFIATIRKHGRFAVRRARNDVLDGIRRTAEYLRTGRIAINRGCADTIREFGLYRWDEKCAEDKPIKEHDHAMDDIRYFCNTILRKSI